MKKILFYTILLIATSLFTVYIIIFRLPDETWFLDDPTVRHSNKANVFVSGLGWCGEITYSNDEDCEFLLLVTAKTDTLFYYPIKAPANRKETRYKYKNFTLNNHKEIMTHYIPVKVKKGTNIRLKFHNTISCKN